ncbi:hypothetical protein IC582_001216 [Cucumis melo]|uniref:NEP1-interacting protein-like 2 isoform X2 n=1 Tax=Cucumis melo TaxID=3656 RepID=A0A1S3BIQ9_CUCME|nr:NEP1-interacting protein-like 2 isoform X2 [Cucumis melo]
MLVVEFKEQLFFDKALRFLAEALKTIALALLLSLLALVGACVGTVIGAFKGHGAAIGAIAGAAVALQIVSCTASGQRYYCLSREAIMESLMDGKGLMNWASNFSEYMHREISEFVDVAGESCAEGLSMESVQMLPVCEYDHSTINSISCSICLEEFEDGEIGRILPNCDHFFHVGCIDQWLHLHGSCPICRKFCI